MNVCFVLEAILIIPTILLPFRKRQKRSKLSQNDRAVSVVNL